MSVLATTLNGETSFNIYPNPKDIDKNVFDNYYLIAMITFIIVNLLVQMIYMAFNKTTLKKGYAYFLTTFYGLFFVGSLTYGILTIA